MKYDGVVKLNAQKKLPSKSPAKEFKVKKFQTQNHQSFQDIYESK